MKAPRIQRFGPPSVITIDACPRPEPGASELLGSTAVPNKITEMFDSGKPVTDVGTVFPLEEARHAHEMLEGAPHKRGKIVLSVAV